MILVQGVAGGRIGLRRILHSTSYGWQFVPEAGGSFTDVGATNCH